MSISLISAGAVSTGTTSVTPAFGQATAAGNLPVAWVIGNVSGATTSAAGWTLAVGSGASTIFYKQDCGAGETAPTFTLAGGAFLAVALAEFSGAARGSPLDKKSPSVGGGLSPAVAALSAADISVGELFVSCGQWSLSKASTCTTADTYNNGATPTTNLNNDATSATTHYRFAWGTTTGTSSADQTSQSCDSMNINTLALVAASFKLEQSPAPPENFYQQMEYQHLLRR